MSTSKIVSTIPKGTPVAVSGWQLAQDMSVEFEFTGAYVIATSSWVDEYGHGGTKGEAQEDLLNSLLGLYGALQEQQKVAELADELTKTLGKLDSLLVRVS